jgi:hypothetical protein
LLLPPNTNAQTLFPYLRVNGNDLVAPNMDKYGRLFLKSIPCGEAELIVESPDFTLDKPVRFTVGAENINLRPKIVPYCNSTVKIPITISAGLKKPTAACFDLALCPNTDEEINFQILSGDWYSRGRKADAVFLENDCLQADFSRLPPGAGALVVRTWPDTENEPPPEAVKRQRTPKWFWQPLGEAADLSPSPANYEPTVMRIYRGLKTEPLRRVQGKRIKPVPTVLPPLVVGNGEITGQISWQGRFALPKAPGAIPYALIEIRWENAGVVARQRLALGTDLVTAKYPKKLHYSGKPQPLLLEPKPIEPATFHIRGLPPGRYKASWRLFANYTEQINETWQLVPLGDAHEIGEQLVEEGEKIKWGEIRLEPTAEEELRLRKEIGVIPPFSLFDKPAFHDKIPER